MEDQHLEVVVEEQSSSDLVAAVAVFVALEIVAFAAAAADIHLVERSEEEEDACWGFG